ncbi:MAG TPA: 3D domain-containing protein [bacterium]|nr:3D domain-containing protein [bacterium]
MQPHLLTLPARSPRAGGVRQVLLVCLVVSVLYPLYLAVGTWGLPFGRTVHVHADGRNLTFRSFRRTVGDAVQSAQIPLQPGDRTVPAAGTFLYGGIDIKIVRAVQVVLTLGRAKSSVRVAASTVGEALHVLGVNVGQIDRVYPDAADAVYPGIPITVERREWRSWVEQRSVGYTSTTVADPQLYKGNRMVRTPGRPGIDRRIVQALYANERPATMVPQAWTMLRPPVTEVVAVGTRAMIASRGDFAGHEYMMLEATAYYSGPNNYGGGIGPRTAIGLLAQRGVVAVDPSVIPLGSHLFIEGYGYAIAGDTGGAIQGMRIDLCFNTYDDAINFGRRTVKVYILDRH